MGTKKSEGKVNLEQFCENHYATKENPAGNDCIGHLAEARVFKCPYKIKDIGAAYSLGEPVVLGIERCPDFELNKNMAKYLLKNFGNDKFVTIELFKELYKKDGVQFRKYLTSIVEGK